MLFCKLQKSVNKAFHIFFILFQSIGLDVKQRFNFTNKTFMKNFFKFIVHNRGLSLHSGDKRPFLLDADLIL